MTRLQQLTMGLGFVCMHIFVDCWITLPILVSIEKVIDGSSSNNLIEVIMAALLKGGGLTKEDLSKKLLCFGTVG